MVNQQFLLYSIILANGSATYFTLSHQQQQQQHQQQQQKANNNFQSLQQVKYVGTSIKNVM